MFRFFPFAPRILAVLASLPILVGAADARSHEKTSTSSTRACATLFTSQASSLVDASSPNVRRYLPALPSLYEVGYQVGSATANTFTSARELSRDAANGTRAYVRDVIDSKGSRLLFRATNADPHAAYRRFLTPLDEYYADNWRVTRTIKASLQFVPRRIIGLLRGENGRVNGLLKGDPRYALTPMSGLQYNLLDAPIYSISKFMKLKRQYVSSMVLSLAALGGGLGYAQMKFVDPEVKVAQDAWVEKALTDNAVKHADIYQRLIQYDVRYQDIRNYRDQKRAQKMSPAQRAELDLMVLKAARLREDSNQSFVETFDVRSFEPTVENLTTLVEKPEFEHLKSRVWLLTEENGSRPVNVAQWKTIVSLNYTFNSMTDLIPYVVGNSPELPNLLKNPKVRVAHDTLLKMKFPQEVIHRVRQKYLTANEGSLVVGQWLLYKTRLAEARVFGVPSEEMPAIADIEADLLKQIDETRR